MAFIDALRGIAAVWVATLHFQSAIWNGDVSPWPSAVRSLFSNGHLGVDVFFVLSGFVIAMTVSRATVNGRYVGAFIVRRSLRLDPTYWTVIFLTCGLAIFKHSTGLGANRALFSVGDILTNMFYLNHLTHSRAVLPVGWTLCLEVQFYLVFVLICWLVQAMFRDATTTRRKVLFFLPLTIYSLAIQHQIAPQPIGGLFLAQWYMFFIGAMTWWVVSREASAVWLFLLCGAAVIGWEPASVTAVVTAIAIFFAGRTGRLNLTETWRPIQYLGLISYSFYLMPALSDNLLTIDVL